MRYTEGLPARRSCLERNVHAAESSEGTYIGSEHLFLGLMEEAAMRLPVHWRHSSWAGTLRNSGIDLVGRGILHRYRRMSDPSLVAILEDAKELPEMRGAVWRNGIAAAIIHAPCSSASPSEEVGCRLNQLCTLCSSDTAYGVRMERNRMDTLSRKNCPALFQYGKLMTDPSNPYRYDPLIGREKELQQMIRILSRRTKNNPCLIGEAGVGKTAIVEGIARKILQGDVPESLQQMQLFALDLPALLSGAKYRGDFEERLKNCLAEASEHGN
ncbi:MAG: AAA family ATPase, partial [Ruminococcus callidus]